MKNAYELASMAECGAPATRDSAGALFLLRARDALVKAWELGSFDDQDKGDLIHELADAAPSVCTYTAWQQFVDLAAWEEEPEAGEWPGDLTKAAMMALYQIAERLMVAILDDLRDADYGILTNLQTGSPIRPATRAEWASSVRQVFAGRPEGAFEGDDGRAVFVAGGPAS